MGSIAKPPKRDCFGGQINQWGDEVISGLTNIFPAELEINLFLNSEIPFSAVSGDYQY